LFPQILFVVFPELPETQYLPNPGTPFDFGKKKRREDPKVFISAANKITTREDPKKHPRKNIQKIEVAVFTAFSQSKKQQQKIIFPKFSVKFCRRNFSSRALRPSASKSLADRAQVPHACGRQVRGAWQSGASGHLGRIGGPPSSPIPDFVASTKSIQSQQPGTGPFHARPTLLRGSRAGSHCALPPLCPRTSPGVKK
jgi:hypothetical protein